MFQLKSIIPGVDWPGLPNPRGCQLLALQFQLERSQWLAPDEIAREQARLAWRLYRHALANIPFYREGYAAAGFGPDSLRSPDDWRRLPLLRREDVQTEFARLQCQPGEHGELSTAATTGSSGSPVVVVGTAVTRILWHALTLRGHLWHRRDFAGKLAVIRQLRRGGQAPFAARTPQKEPVPEAQKHRLDNWGGATVDVVETGPMVAMDIQEGIEAQAAWLAREDPDYLLTYPSIAAELAEHMRREGLTLSRLREVRTFGELLEPRVRAICQEVWGAPVVDGYSSQEVGYIAIQCPETQHYHVQAESVLVKVLDDDGRPCQAGQIGRVVVTTLQNFAMPLVRYEIGDYAEVGERCPCGRGLPVLRRIVGRQRNMAVLPDGRMIWPSLNDELLKTRGPTGLPPIRQIQFVQTEPDAVEVRLVAPRRLSAEEEALAPALVEQAFGWPMRVTVRYVETIERGPGGKFEDYRCMVPAETIEQLRRQRRAGARMQGSGIPG